MKDRKPPETDFFWDLAKKLLARREVTEGSLMGFPCLRVDGEFFGACDHRTGDLFVKLPAERVQDLIQQELGQPFAPAGRVFKEWVLVCDRDRERWRALLDEAMKFVAA